MANLFEHEDRRVVPNWRSFGRTTIIGELNSFQKERSEPHRETSIDEYIIDFELSPTVIHAADLLSAAIVNNKRNNAHAIKAAQFILKNNDKTTSSQISLAQSFLNKEENIDVSARFENVGTSNLSVVINPIPFYEKINETKHLLRVNPKNTILYVELSRYYSVLGQEKNSVKAMKTALHLAPNNRFVLRSAARLFAHFNTIENDYLEYIHHILKNNPMTYQDPWLTAAEISISTIRGVNSNFIKNGIQLINSGNISPFNFTELASSIGTVELLNGSKKSRSFFDKSLISPNDNTLAQIEWASTKDHRLDVVQDKFQVKLNYEALALEYFQNSEYEKSIENAAKWFSDQPFSKRPIMFGSNLASTILKDQEKSIAFLKAGLTSHPYDPQLINNLAYSLALDNKPQEAFEEINKIKPDVKIDTSTKVCLSATKGLAFFRSGYPEIGRQFYLEAIAQTNTINNRNLNWVAILNYAREEILQKTEYADSLINSVNKIPKDTQDVVINTLRNDLIELYKANKS